MAGRVGTLIAKWTTAVVILALGVGGAVAYAKRGEIQDYFVAQGFSPSQRIQQVLDTVDFTPSGERIFLASQPTIGGREDFGHWCANVDHAEEGHVLGCYADGRIRLFDISDDRLDGIVEVTAAHELLHAVYSRMSHSERQEITTILHNTYSELIETDSDLEERMSVYEQLSPTAFTNELHSVLGTEVIELPEALQSHYARWIVDRDTIAGWYHSYHSVFTELSAEAERLGVELEALRGDIEERSLAYDEAVRAFNEDAAEFKARNERYEFSGNAELFSQTRDELLFRQSQLGDTLAGIQEDTAKFNELREQLIALNDVSTELNDVLNSALPEPTTHPEADTPTDG